MSSRLKEKLSAVVAGKCSQVEEVVPTKQDGEVVIKLFNFTQTLS